MAEAQSILGKTKQNKKTTYRENWPLVLDFLFAVTWMEGPSYVLHLSVFTQIHSYFMFTKKTRFSEVDLQISLKAERQTSVPLFT